MEPNATELSPQDALTRLQDDPEVLQLIKTRWAYISGAPQSTDTSDLNATDIVSRLQVDPSARRRALEVLRSRNSERQPEDVPDKTGAETMRGQGHEKPVASPSTPSYYRDENRPELSRVPIPYGDMPALRDLYAQIAANNRPLTRFGEAMFRRSTPEYLDFAAADVPAGPDYVLGPGDGLTIEIWGGVSQRLSRVVDREGQISLPDAGTVVLAGRTLADAEETVQHRLAPQIHNVKVALSLARVRSVRVYVVGDVEAPGAYDLSGLSTPLNALYAAGGPTERGSFRCVRHLRGNRIVQELDLYDFLLHGMSGGTQRLQSGDTVFVPPSGPQIAVVGMVRRPAVYEIRKEAVLADVLDMAGGVLAGGALSKIDIERVQAHQQHTMVTLSLPDSENPADIRAALSGFQIQDGDRITIAPILPYQNQAVYLDGHVFRPGKYAYKKGLTVREFIRSYDELMPEPADRAEIIRLMPPDYRPTVIDFSLNDVLAGDDPPELQPFDTVRIFGRYAIDAPKVHVYGEVLRPGEYPLSHGMTIAALVRMAGGFKRSAYKQTGDLASYVVQDGKNILTSHRTVDLPEALDGGQKDVVLKPGDVLTIRQIPGWQDIGAAITLNGEVMYPGTYGIEENEKLSSVLKRAGGFRSHAYAAGAVLERTSVRELAEKNRDEMIRRIEETSPKLSAASAKEDQAALVASMQQQRDHVLAALRRHPASGRLVIQISDDISKWENTPADVAVRAGDVLTVPKLPTYVEVYGQVQNSAAVSYVPGKTAGWYLSQAGGVTELANKKEIFIVRANGSVVGGNSGMWRGDVLRTRLHPGDSVIVPEKIIGGSSGWKTLLTAAEFTSSMAIAARVATSF
jgi:protein involved in polysaccharide export with SLBB domain